MADRQEDPRAADDRRKLALGDAAIDWLVLLRSGRATPGDHAGFAAWRGQSPAHEAAARDAEALFRDIGRTGAARAHHLAAEAAPRSGRGSRPAARSPAQRRTRRAILGGAVAASAVLLAAHLGGFDPAFRRLADQSTGVGERRRVVLDDGTVAILNTATALSVDYSAAGRRVVLHSGEALFEVARDPGRPFVVAAAAGEARAVGTAFAVRRNDADTDVLVAEGTVEVRLGDGPPTRLTAGHHLVYGRRRVGPPEPVDAEAATAWRRGKLIFDRRPLGEVVAELQRYRLGGVMILDPDLRALKVSGVFDLDDPQLLFRILEDATPARLTRLPLLTIIR